MHLNGKHGYKRQVKKVYTLNLFLLQKNIYMKYIFCKVYICYRRPAGQPARGSLRLSTGCTIARRPAARPVWEPGKPAQPHRTNRRPAFAWGPAMAGSTMARRPAGQCSHGGLNRRSPCTCRGGLHAGTSWMRRPTGATNETLFDYFLDPLYELIYMNPSTAPTPPLKKAPSRPRPTKRVPAASKNGCGWICIHVHDSCGWMQVPKSTMGEEPCINSKSSKQQKQNILSKPTQ